jgi:ribonuclease E
MTKRMLIDASHAEETRVVVLDGNRLEDFDVETATKRQLKGNIYLAKVVRVEPSLQAAFVEYGGNRHGFLAFDEIHPDYYQIPVADRQRLLQMQAEQARQEEEEADRDAEELSAEAESAEDLARTDDHDAESSADTSDVHQPQSPDAFPPADDSTSAEVPAAQYSPAQPLAIEVQQVSEPARPPATTESSVEVERSAEPEPPLEPEPHADTTAAQPLSALTETVDESGASPELLAEREQHQPEAAAEPSPPELANPNGTDEPVEEPLESEAEDGEDQIPESPPPELIGGEHDTVEDSRERRIPYRFLRNYKIQEVIRRRQILLVQVAKEERGTKGAALTTYISLAGRYCVLMPNSPRGGGISRKITSIADRRRLKEVMAELDLPQGMGLIVRTAGANRPKSEIKRDCEYLLRLWDDIREHTMRSVAPALIYEEANLIKRAIRDVYSRDVDEVIVDGEEGWRAARDFMRMLMPSHVKKVQLWRDGGQPLFARYQVDAQLDAMLSPTVQLRSGGYMVINQTEALVAIDVNSGRSTRERGIEETALRTNLEAADEVARQLRLRDLAGLIVIDFIDMEPKKHNGMVERRLKEALKADRARIQLGHISHFGLLEMSRQRLRPSLAETSFITCPHCGGAGHVRSTESAAIHVLRGIEEEGARRRAAEIVVHTAGGIALYIFNHKRERLAEIESRTGMDVTFAPDQSLLPPQYRIERLLAQTAPEPPAAITAGPMHVLEEADESEEPANASDPGESPQAFPAAPAQPPIALSESGNGAWQDTAPATPDTESAEEIDRRRRRRRRRRRGSRREDATIPGEAPAEPDEQASAHVEGVPEFPEPQDAEDEAARRRNRRGGRRRRRGPELPQLAEPGAEQPDVPPFYAGPTPADPFGGRGFDIFEALERAEEQTLPIIMEEPDGEVRPDIQPEPAAPRPAEKIEPAPEAHEAEPTPPLVPAADSVPPPPSPANDPGPPQPAILPIVVGAETAPNEKKRGWWRR